MAFSCKSAHKVIWAQNYYWFLWQYYFMAYFFDNVKYKYHDNPIFFFGYIKKKCYLLECFGIKLESERDIELTRLTTTHPDYALWCTEIEPHIHTVGYCKSRFLETYGQENGFILQCSDNSHFNKYEEKLPLHLKDQHHLSLDKSKKYMKICIFILKTIKKLNDIENEVQNLLKEKESIYSTILKY